MENCVRCNVSGEKIRLFDTIYNGKMAKICERCSIIENIPLIEKPDDSLLKDSGKTPRLHDRFKKTPEIKELQEQESREERLRMLDRNPKLELPLKEQLNLMEHFNWEIMKNRRRKGLSHKQLAQATGEPEVSIEMLEKGKIPENAEMIIRKLEQFFQINLRKIGVAEEFMAKKEKMSRTRPILLDEYGNELDKIPEPETESNLEENREKEILMMEKPKESPRKKIGDKMFELGRPWRRGSMMLKDKQTEEKTTEFPEKPCIELAENKDLDLNKIDTSRVTIKDLRELHKKKILATKQEMAEEQEKIEERQRLIEARKEELRLMKERQSKNIDNVLGGSELFSRKKPTEE